MGAGATKQQGYRALLTHGKAGRGGEEGGLGEEPQTAVQPGDPWVMFMGSPRAQTAHGHRKSKPEVQSGAGVEGLFISCLSAVFELYNNVQVLF